MSGGSGDASAAVTTSHQAWLCCVAQGPHGISVEDSVTRGGRYHSLSRMRKRRLGFIHMLPRHPYMLPMVVIRRQGGWFSLTQMVRQQSWTVEEGLGG